MRGDFGEELSKLKVNIHSFKENLTKEKAARDLIKNGMISFGIPFFDRSMIGLMPSDILLVGAKTGQGKTTLITQMSHNFAKQGKRVALFALEAREYEIEQRLKFSCYCRHYFSDPYREFTHVRFPEWLNGLLDCVFSKYDEAVDKELSCIENLNVLYRTSTDFNIETFEKSFMAIQSQTDVFIIDHLHYFDTEGLNENKEFTDITKKIRDLALLHNKAVVLVAHIRKKTNFQDKSIIPSIDDFHGSSNISKIATKAVMLGSYQGGDSGNKYGALFHIPKFREDGSVARYYALMHLEQSTGMYSQSFSLGRIIDDKTTKLPKFEPLEDDKLPYWAKGPQYERDDNIR